MGSSISNGNSTKSELGEILPEAIDFCVNWKNKTKLSSDHYAQASSENQAITSFLERVEIE